MIVEINNGEMTHIENTSLDLESIALAAEQAPEGVEVEITKTPHTLLVKSMMGTKLFIELKAGAQSLGDGKDE